LATALGARGRAFVEAHNAWDAVLPRYERVMHALTGAMPESVGRE
jgi:hypothetical protein